METLGSDLDALVTNDGIVPSQYADAHSRADPFFAERRLWIRAFESVLEDWRVAHMESRLFPSPARRAFWRQELTEWFQDDSEAPLSFRWYCDVLNFDPSATRARLLNGWASVVPRDNSSGRQITPRPKYERRVA